MSFQLSKAHKYLDIFDDDIIYPQDSPGYKPQQSQIL